VGLNLRTVRRIILLIAGLALMVTPVVGLVPVHARPLIASPPPGVENVNCGTVFASTKWSNDDGCEGPILSRAGLMAMMFLIALGSGAVGLVLLFTDARRGL
jgi:hypothetical protein